MWSALQDGENTGCLVKRSSRSRKSPSATERFRRHSGSKSSTRRNPISRKWRSPKRRRKKKRQVARRRTAGYGAGSRGSVPSSWSRMTTTPNSRSTLARRRRTSRWRSVFRRAFWWPFLLVRLREAKVRGAGTSERIDVTLNLKYFFSS
uniref:(northern house mosquito) hypothetical protein n=1 Tax=Culex pipiens TaxID=7175 RepID=A0A8D8JI04_CULPI